MKEQGIRNVVAIGGDLHAFQCGVVRDDPDPATGAPVIVDFVCAGISSTSFYTYLKAAWRGTPLAKTFGGRCRRGTHKPASVISLRTVSLARRMPWHSHSFSHASVGPKSA
ncbi:hypothetical protein WI38_23130 [Burkholderia ubonensis]|uniref:PhoD-like phosphatase metallophosphatase domain-containing protein n=1 Tax=Burkholderia ubonensis TaxID=101571 RepID=A0A102LML1_9BURK|nr:hypothetical protein WI35_32500 [Burkholderia ubonensis]KUZ86748.1 hypothetical protein WI38_23130 [Burkholderia ubonensis]KUZ96417.1 hypothetical protein WI39_12420 [Burkholderia ubonensis]